MSGESIVEEINNYSGFPEMIPFSECRYENFEMRKRFDLDSRRINSIDISSCGDYMVASTDIGNIYVFDILSGCEINYIPTQKYGCEHVKFIKNELNTLHTSTKINDDIRYLSLEGKKYIRYFHGHNDKVLSLSMSPVGRNFLSSSMDGTVKLWDFKSEECCETFNYMNKNPVITYDPKGIIYCVFDEKNIVKFFDSRYMNCRPFKIIRVKSTDWKIGKVKFSPDGRKVLVSGDGSYFYVFDTFTDEIISFRGIRNYRRFNFGVDFSPCSRYVVGASDFGELFYYDALRGNRLKKFKSAHNENIGNVVFHRKYLMLITSGSDLIFWTPDYDNEVFGGLD